MLTTLADGQTNLFEVMSNVFSRGDTLAHPSDLIPQLQNMWWVWSVLLLAAGITSLFYGFRYYKSVTVVMALGIGLVAGYYLGKKIHAEYIVAMCMGVLLATICFPLMKYAVAVMGGLVGAFLGANAWSALSHLGNTQAARNAAENYWIGALMGLVICGMLAFVLFKLSVVLFTSVSGSTIAVFGAVALLLQVPSWTSSISNSVGAHPVVLPLIVFVPMMIGLILQQAKPGAGKPEGGGKPAVAKA